jgi:hypothetical protein
MSEDRILRELGHLAKEEGETEKARLDERWDRLAAGTLTPEEDAELRALAAASPEAREAYEAFRPLGAEFQARVVNEIAGEIEKDKPETEPPQTRARLLPFRPATLRRAGWLTAAAAAAGLFLLLRGPATLPLPEYRAELSGGIKTFRGEESPASGPPVFLRSSTLTVVVRPRHPVKGEVIAFSFLARGDQWMPWQSALESQNGSVRIRGELYPWLQPGVWRLWVVVGRPGKLPPSAHDAEAEIRAGRIRHEQWQAVYTDLRIVDRPPS